jgi:hypothetical protein
MARRSLVALVVLASLSWPVQGQEPVASSRIVAVSLFKNGLAVVQREVDIAKAGTYRLDAMPDAVHGTFWIESNTQVEAAVRLRDVESAADPIPEGSLQEIFAGKKVTIHFTNNKLGPFVGTVLKPAVRPKDLTSHEYAGVRPERFLVLKTAKGHMYIQPSEVAIVETEEVADKVTQRKPALVLTVGPLQQKPRVLVTYLSHGLAWAPSYRVDITDPKKLAIEMATVLRNELADFEKTEVRLISGFPSVEFANVSSPLQAQTTWAKFFQELANRSAGEHAILTQQTLANPVSPSSAPRLNMSAIPAGEGVDLHFESIGKRSLLKGEALSLTMGKAQAEYERIVEWTVGKRHGTPSDRTPVADEMWDVLHFKNPFPFPLTTAPALVMENDKFNGQRTCYWTNVGEETNLRVTKSLSVRTLCQEEEDKTRPAERVAVGRHDYTRLHLRGELVANNHRKQAVKIHIIYMLQGNLTAAEGSPRVTVREGTLTEINPARDLTWVITLQPGEEKKIVYSYNTLVDR